MEKKYNLVIVVPDQLRKDYLGCYGHLTINTPNIDQLATEGIKFDNLYCASPLCGPSRVSFATSTYVGEHNHRNYWSTISPDVPNLVTAMKKAGYRTGMFGKNHLFTYERLEEVWDELDEICLGNYDGHPEYTHSFSAFTLEKDHPFNITERLTDQGMEFMERNSEQPFLLWINYQDPHPAYCCPEPYSTMYDSAAIELGPRMTEYDPEKQPIRNSTYRTHSEMELCSEDDLKRVIAHYMGQVSYVDDNIGRLVAKIRELEIEKDTIFLFFSDHGELLGDFWLTHKNPTFYESLAAIPAILVHPNGEWRDLSYDGLVEEVDLTPTLLTLLGIPVPKTMVGKNLVPSIEDGSFSGKETILCEAGGGAPTCTEVIDGYRQTAPHAPTSFGPGAMIRYQHYKLSLYADDRGELYDLERDPLELVNCYEDPAYATIRSEMTTMLVKRLLSVKVRDVGIDWDCPEYPHDVRFEPLEFCGTVVEDIRASGEYVSGKM